MVDRSTLNPERTEVQLTLRRYERRLVRWTAHQPGALSRRTEASLRYAVNLARTGLLRVDRAKERDVNLWPVLESYRSWLLDALRDPLGSRTKDARRLTQLAPALRRHTQLARRRLLETFADSLSEDRLDQEICQKKLVLVLGGGGGAGFAHLGAFSLLHTLDWEPSLIVGSSMGGMLGLFRAVQKRWDPMGTLLALPRRFDLESLFSPFAGATRYGFPGALLLRLRKIGGMAFDLLTGSDIPDFNGLAIPLELVVTGVRRGLGAEKLNLGGSERDLNSLSGFRLRRRFMGIAKTVRTLTSNPNLLKELVMGRDALTRSCNVVDAVGFSCAVPGLFCYDLSEDTDPQTVNAIKTLFEAHRLWGMIDGGVVNNVPSRVAYESVQAGTLGSRNAFIYALDPFAPRVNGNLLFLPLQRIARRSVVANRRYSDWHKTYASPPSPVRLALGLRRLQEVGERTHKELAVDRGFLERMKQPLPRFSTLYRESTGYDPPASDDADAEEAYRLFG